jgi:hypothetical protein
MVAIALMSAWAPAQGGFVGLGGGALWIFSPQVPPSFQVGLQIGVEVAPGVSGRLLGELYPFEPGAAAYRLALDVLATTELAERTVGYLGGGPGVLISPVEGVFPELHATGGIEVMVSDEIGLFGELQFIIIVPVIRLGANHHF